jgi:hypothetical protein
MATTYTEIASVTVGSGGASSIAFSSIPNIYTDLKVFISGRCSDSGNAWNVGFLRFNTDTNTANYSSKYMFAFSSSVGSASGNGLAGYIPNETKTEKTFSNTDIYFPNYLSNQYKSWSVDSVTESNSATLVPSQLTAGLWNGNDAINAITFTIDTGNWTQYTTAYLYGIKNS